LTTSFGANAHTQMKRLSLALRTTLKVRSALSLITAKSFLNTSIRCDDARLVATSGRVRRSSLGASDLVDQSRVLSLPLSPISASDVSQDSVDVVVTVERALQFAEAPLARTGGANRNDGARDLEPFLQFEVTRPSFALLFPISSATEPIL
jgi:hypothetical protein